VASNWERGAKLDRLGRALANPTAALRQIGALMVAESQAAFRNQSFGDTRWPERHSPNIFGILADFHAGRSAPPSRRFQPRPALRDTGRLSGSIAFELVGRYAVRAGTNVEYAEVHQTGGKVESVPIDVQVRTALWAWLKRKPKALRKQLGWLLNKKFRDKRLQSTVPARPFVGVTSDTVRAVEQVVGVTILEAGR
jgi:phage gpG-like protein